LRVPTDPLLSVAMPVFNERTTIKEIVGRVPAVKMRIELTVDDVSTDEVTEILEQLQKTRRFVLLRRLHNDAPSRRSTGDLLIIKAAYPINDVLDCTTADSMPMCVSTRRGLGRMLRRRSTKSCMVDTVDRCMESRSR
jgi:hypothetical protein